METNNLDESSRLNKEQKNDENGKVESNQQFPKKEKR